MAISAFNDLYVWGWNVNGQLGLPVYEKYEITQKDGKKLMEKQRLATVFPSPMIVDLPKGDSTNDIDYENHYSPLAVAAGARHTVVKTADGTLLGTGWNKYGQLANEHLEEDIDRFQVIDASVMESIDFAVVCGEWSTILVPRSA